MDNCAINLKQYLNSHISKICSNDFHKNSDNHCAHFVSHVLGFRFGFRCINMTGKGEKSHSASIRVQEVFANSTKVGAWIDKPSNLEFCLAFVTSSNNVNLPAKTMQNHPRKHIGIYHNGMIYHYSNGKNKVVSQNPEDFANHYPGNDIAVYYGMMPQ